MISTDVFLTTAGAVNHPTSQEVCVICSRYFEFSSTFQWDKAYTYYIYSIHQILFFSEEVDLASKSYHSTTKSADISKKGLNTPIIGTTNLIKVAMLHNIRYMQLATYTGHNYSTQDTCFKRSQ